jgi:aspartyl-tRNA(Asn)/glutamyl-tRNA(Gln) amidotransferase subunit B
VTQATAATETRYEAVIGIECHVELKTESKMFCGCRNAFGSEPNTNVCPTCLGMPGALPVPNRHAIEHIVRAGLAFGATIPAFSKFDRKNYFYPDMPKDYQISQYDMPLTIGGTVEFWLPDGSRRACRLTRIHLEEDTGKSIHGGSSDGRIAGSAYSLVDFNRAGVPLMECVSEPDIRSADEAVAFLDALKRTFVSLGVSDVKMEEGSLRCDANVSIRPAGATSLGTKAEIKNMNSFRSVHRAIQSEIARQESILRSGGRIVQETRGWDEAAGTTHTMRSKEQAHDYRYFPDPDLVPIEYAAAEVERFRANMGELPQERVKRYVETFGLPVAVAHQLVDSRSLADHLDAAVGVHGAPPRPVANLLLGDLSRLMNEAGLSQLADTFTPAASASLVKLTESHTITSKAAKDVLAIVWREGRLPEEIVEREGLAQVSDRAAIEAFVRDVIAAQPKSAADYRAGKENALQFLKGQVMKASRGKADPMLAEELLKERLAGE